VYCTRKAARRPRLTIVWRPYYSHDAIVRVPACSWHLDGRPKAMSERPLVRCLTTGEVVTAEETLVQHNDGSRGVSLIWASPVRNAAGDIVAAVAVAQDITGEHLSPRVCDAIAIPARCCRCAVQPRLPRGSEGPDVDSAR